jgi:hypothetical protein
MKDFDWDSFVEESKKYKACACIWIAVTLPHIFYVGLIPIYFGYISIRK